MENSEKKLPEANRSRADKILFIAVGLAIVISVGATYWRIMIKKDYLISSQVDCDPTLEKCFVWECDETLAEGTDGACTGNEDEDVWYYKIAQRKAADIPLCDPEKDENCQPFLCDENEKGCSETFCDVTNVPEGESCNDPEEYVKNNPAEEDADANVDDAGVDSEELSEE